MGYETQPEVPTPQYEPNFLGKLLQVSRGYVDGSHTRAYAYSVVLLLGLTPNLGHLFFVTRTFVRR